MLYKRVPKPSINASLSSVSVAYVTMRSLHDYVQPTWQCAAYTTMCNLHDYVQPT